MENTKMKLTFVTPRRELQPYIKSLWVFESAEGMPQNDTNLAAPNGCPKLLVLYENSLVSTVEGRNQESPEDYDRWPLMLSSLKSLLETGKPLATK